MISVMTKKLIQDLLVLHVAGIGVLLFGDAVGPRNISLFLFAEIAWLLLFGLLVVKSHQRRLLVPLSLPIFLVVEWKLFLISAMSLPYIMERVLAK
jgi:hypothetical protein